jgi:arsenite methyltransferase
MQNDEEIKKIVKEKYSTIAEGKVTSCCSGSSCCGPADKTVVNVGDSYEGQKGYVKEADLGLGCGLPTEFADIKEEDTVVDLGSGAGNDVFVARAFTGDTGKVIGVDMTESMINKAEANKKKLGFTNVEFRLGEIENLPLENDSANVVISNCVLNLVSNKQKAFGEIYRVLKPGGHFCISDIVINGVLPERLKKSAELYAGCIAGALTKEEYLGIIEKTGFKNIQVKKSKTIQLPDNTLQEFGLSKDIEEFRKSGGGVFSITVVGEKI